MEELNQSVRKSPLRRSRKQIVKLLKKYDSKEGLTIVEFCRLHDINKSNFYNWQKRYGGNQADSSKPKGFVPVEVSHPTSQSSADSVPSLFAEVNGIRLYHVVPADYLKALIS